MKSHGAQKTVQRFTDRSVILHDEDSWNSFAHRVYPIAIFTWPLVGRQYFAARPVCKAVMRTSESRGTVRRMPRKVYSRAFRRAAGLSILLSYRMCRKY